MRSFTAGDDVARIRDRIDHPVIDSDGHLIEYFPIVRDNVRELGGESLASGFESIVNMTPPPPGLSRDQLRGMGRSRGPWWGLPAANTLDRATAMLPGLLHRRLDELGIDVAVLYPTGGLTVTALPMDELRQAAARAYNQYYAEAYAPYRDRLITVACIPCFNPQEAIAEVEHAVNELGFKAVMLAGVIARPVEGAESTSARWIDTLAHDSPFDYDPLWATLDRLGVAATFHASGMGWGSRTSTSNYAYNHIGNFAAAGEAIARSLFFAGVPRRYPTLRFAFQEGGIALAASLFADLLGHWSKRNTEAIAHYDPARLDRSELVALFDEFATGATRERLDEVDFGLGFLSSPEPEATRDEFVAARIDVADDIVSIFADQYFFGCEADDPMNALAFDTRINPHGTQLRAVFASDIGHWDVPDFREVLPEAYELVEDGLLTDDDFRRFTFTNAVDLWAGDGGDFFSGTIVEDAVKAHQRGA